jgi:hypothetical protein
LTQDSSLTTDAGHSPTGYERTSGDYKIWQVISAVGTMIEWSVTTIYTKLFTPSIFDENRR